MLPVARATVHGSTQAHWWTFLGDRGKLIASSPGILAGPFWHRTGSRWKLSDPRPFPTQGSRGLRKTRLASHPVDSPFIRGSRYEAAAHALDVPGRPNHGTQRSG